MTQVLKRTWKWIVGVSVLTTTIAVTAVYSAPSKINIIGFKSFVVCQNQLGNRIEHEISNELYDSLATKPIPQYTQETCKAAYQRWKYDTVDGDIHNNEYVELSGEWFVALNNIALSYSKTKYPTLNSALLKASTIINEFQAR